MHCCASGMIARMVRRSCSRVVRFGSSTCARYSSTSRVDTPAVSVRVFLPSTASRTAVAAGVHQWPPRRDIEPLCVELFVERQVMGGEARQLLGVVDGVGIHARAWR